MAKRRLAAAQPLVDTGTVSFIVYGAPQAKGSARAFIPLGWASPVITTTNKNLKAWEQLVRAEAQRHAAKLILGPVRLALEFHLPRPKSVPKKGRPHISRPDCSKLVRGLEDALTGICWRDDSQVVEIAATKSYVDLGFPPHVVVTVSEL